MQVLVLCRCLKQVVMESMKGFERMVKDQLEALADPEAPARFHRAERFARREYGQNYFWQPGQVAPE